MINVCLFGAGRMAQDHALNIHLNQATRLAGVVDPCLEAAKKLAETYDLNIYRNHEEALNDSVIDAVAIVSSSETHSELIIASANAGKGIFCEKPIDLERSRTEACVRAVREAGVPFLLGFNRRFDPGYRSLQEQVRKGVVGETESVHITSRDCPAPSLAYLKTSGGMFHDMTIHDFDIACWLLMEEPEEVFAAGSALIIPEISEFGDVDTALVTLKTASGKLCQISNSRRTSFGYDQRLEVFGSEGMLRVANLTPTTVEFTGDQGVLTDRPLPGFSRRYAQAYQLEIGHFCEEVMQGKPPYVSIEDGLRASCIADAATRSLRTGRPEKICYSPLLRKVKKSTVAEFPD